MTETEELITAALRKQADRAPHSGPIRFALDKPRRRRVPGLIAVIVGVLVVSGISVPMVLLQSKPTPPPPTLENGIPLALKPTYLPAGYVETKRQVFRGGDYQSRSYNRSPYDGRQDTTITLTVFGPSWPRYEGCKPNLGSENPLAEIPRRPGYPPPPGNQGTTRNFISAGWCVELTIPAGLADVEGDLIATSLEPDRIAVAKSAVRFAWLPDYLTNKALNVGGRPSEGAFSHLDVYGPDSSRPFFFVTIAPSEKLAIPDHGDPINAPRVIRNLGDGRTMLVRFFSSEKGGEFTAQEYDQIVRGIEIQPVDYSWLGK